MGYNPLRIPREHNKYHGYTVRGTPNWPMNVEAARCILNYTQSKIDTNWERYFTMFIQPRQFAAIWIYLGYLCKISRKVFQHFEKINLRHPKKNHEENNLAILLTKARHQRDITAALIKRLPASAFVSSLDILNFECKPAPSNGCQMVPFKGVNSPSLSV